MHSLYIHIFVYTATDTSLCMAYTIMFFTIQFLCMKFIIILSKHYSRKHRICQCCSSRHFVDSLLLTRWLTRRHHRSTVAGSAWRSPEWPPAEHDTGAPRPESRVRPALVSSTIHFCALASSISVTTQAQICEKMKGNAADLKKAKIKDTPQVTPLLPSSGPPPLPLPRSSHTSPRLATSVTRGNSTVEFIAASTEGRFLLYCRGCVCVRPARVV